MERQGLGLVLAGDRGNRDELLVIPSGSSRGRGLTGWVRKEIEVDAGWIQRKKSQEERRRLRGSLEIRDWSDDCTAIYSRWVWVRLGAISFLRSKSDGQEK